MKLFVESQFLTKGSTQIPSYPGMRGIGIHSSSDVESVFVGGIKLGIKCVMPLADNSALVESTRPCAQAHLSSPVIGTNFNADIAAPYDGAPTAGDRLVLQIYECNDELNVPGPRAPYLSPHVLSPALQTTRGAAKVVALLPMAGRTRAALNWIASNATCTVNLIGFRMVGSSKAPSFYAVPNTTDYTTPGVIVPAGSNNPTNYLGRTLYIDNESFDYIAVYAWDSAAGQIDFTAEVTGERLT